jgi:hypothetical protein
MASKYKPYDIGIWFEHIDVNSLSDEECAKIAHVDITNDEQLLWLVTQWIRPRYLSWSEQNKREMLEVLLQSENWSEREIKSVAREFHMPSGQKVEDVERFLRVLKAEFLR